MSSVSTSIEQHTAKVGELTFAYLQAGLGDPLVLLHGFPQHSHMWRSIMPALAERFTCHRSGSARYGRFLHSCGWLRQAHNGE